MNLLGPSNPVFMWLSGSPVTLHPMGQNAHATSAHLVRNARRRRDTALERLSTITMAMGVGTIAAVGALGVYVGKALPGHHTTTPGVTSNSTASGPSQSGTAPVSQSSINPPSTPTQYAPAPAPISSGSS